MTLCITEIWVKLTDCFVILHYVSVDFPFVEIKDVSGGVDELVAVTAVFFLGGLRLRYLSSDLLGRSTTAPSLAGLRGGGRLLPSSSLAPVAHVVLVLAGSTFSPFRSTFSSPLSFLLLRVAHLLCSDDNPEDTVSSIFLFV
jgi:hypothetical protein